MMISSGRRSAGFTLLEVLAAVTIFSIAVLGLARAFATNLSFNRLNAERSGAVEAVQGVLDTLRATDPNALPTNGHVDPVRAVTANDHTYEVSVKHCSPKTYCPSNNIRAIHCEARLNGELRYEVDTVFAQLK
jgi:prepilin-type N-terminal cleavage/methylation domain-containing protein